MKQVETSAAVRTAKVNPVRKTATALTKHTRKTHIVKTAPVPAGTKIMGAWDYNEKLLPNVHRRIAATCYACDLSSDFIVSFALRYGIREMEKQLGIDYGKLPAIKIAANEPVPPPFPIEGNDCVYYNVDWLPNMDKRLAAICRKLKDSRNIQTRILQLGLIELEQKSVRRAENSRRYGIEKMTNYGNRMTKIALKHARIGEVLNNNDLSRLMAYLNE